MTVAELIAELKTWPTDAVVEFIADGQRVELLAIDSPYARERAVYVCIDTKRSADGRLMPINESGAAIDRQCMPV